MAAAWDSVGAIDKAEELLIHGLEIASDNSAMRGNYFFILLKQGRLEEADRLLKEQYGDSVAGLPQQLQQYYFVQKSLISFFRGEKDAARNFLEQAIGDDVDQAWDGMLMTVMTMSSALLDDAGATELAQQRLAEAERAVRRARINGVDHAGIHYTESSIQALKGNPAAALESLQMAYDRGFRRIWLLEVDFRLDSLRQEPKFVAIMHQIERDIAEARSEVETIALAVL